MENLVNRVLTAGADMELWQAILMWTAVAIAALFVLGFLLTTLGVGFGFGIMYGRVNHRYSRRVLFSDHPEISVQKFVVEYARRRWLAAYLLGRGNTRGLVVISHGIRDRAEGYFAEALAFVKQGFRVLLYDATGSGASYGRSQRGLPQSAIDLDRVLRWAEAQPQFESLPIYLYGHSWGGYAVCAVFCLGQHPRVRAVCSLSGFNAPCRMLLEGCASASRALGRLFYLPMCMVQFTRYGTGMYRTAEKGMRLAEDVRFLILHAEHDEVIDSERAGIYGVRKRFAPARVTYALIPGRKHLNAWLSERACAENEVYDARYRALAGRFALGLSREKEKEFYAPIDRAERIALSETDDALFARIAHFFTEEDYVAT